MREGQKKDVYEHMRDFGSITSFEAFREYGITRLSAVIFVLRNEGIGIKSTPISVKNRRGKKVRFAKYELMK